MHLQTPQELFGNRIRVRVCGVCMEEGKLLLIKHSSVGELGYLWAPPGGGVEFGESLGDCLVREFKEETGLEIEVGDFLFLNEFIELPLHAIELFFLVRIKSGTLVLGIDPEMGKHTQLIQELKFWSLEELKIENQLGLHQKLRKTAYLDVLFHKK